MTLGFLTVVRNEEDLIEDLLDHVFDIVDEYVVIDDNSDDGTVEVINQFAKKARQHGKRFILITNDTTAGLCEYYLDRGRQLVQSDWVLRLDADERLSDYGVTHLLEYLESSSNDIVIVMRYNYLDDSIFTDVAQEPKPRIFRQGAVYYPTRLHTEETPAGDNIRVAYCGDAHIHINHNKSISSHADDNRRYRSVIESRIVANDDEYTDMSEWYHPVEDALIGISLLTCNGLEEWTIPTIESFRRNTTHPYKMVVLDNGSTDGTVEYLKSECSDFDLIFEEENIGIIKGRNKTFRKLLKDTDVEAICVLHNDMLFPPLILGNDWLKLLWDCMQADIKRGIVSSDIATEPLSNYDAFGGYEAWAVSDYFNREKHEEIPNCNTHPCLYRTSLLYTIGLYDEGFPGKQGHEDWDFNNRTVDAGWEICATTRVRVWHPGAAIRSHLDNANEELTKNMDYYHIKWGSRRW